MYQLLIEVEEKKLNINAHLINFFLLIIYKIPMGYYLNKKNTVNLSLQLVHKRVNFISIFVSYENKYLEQQKCFS